MDKKSYPFSSLTEVELDVILDNARQERAKAVAALLAGVRRWIGTTLRRPFSRAHALLSH